MSRALLVFGLILAATPLGIACGRQEQESQEQNADKPNIVFVLTDDMRADDLEHMPKTQELLVQEGTTFSNAFVSYAQCCPSRASILRGQYVHNHQVLNNVAPGGGFEKFYAQGHESSTVATWLQSAGYETVLMGKYLNGYPGSGDVAHVPPGWDEWYGRMGLINESGYYDYILNENGSLVYYGNRDDDYSTDVLARKAQDFMSRIAPTGQPFFMYVAVGAPHAPQSPARRHKDMFADETVPRSPSYNEADVSDKPKPVRRLSSLTSDETAEVDEIYQDRLGSLQAVDEMVEDIVSELQAQGVLDKTYIVFMSDNGLEQGEHRIKEGKARPYEESIRVPLVVLGPGVPAGKVRSEFALNTDIAPTFVDLAGATVPTFVDGRSLKPLLTEKDSPTTWWRSAFLLESYPGGPNADSGEQTDNPSDRRAWFGIRTTQYKYVEYFSGTNELYDLSADPYELDSYYQDAGPTLNDRLKTRLEALKSCAGVSCRAAEDGR